MGEQARTHAAMRLQKVIDGEQGGISKVVNWQGGGGFRFFTLGETVFDSEGRINEDITFENLAAHIWFSETKTPWSGHARYDGAVSPALGVHNGTAYALLYNGILRDRSVNGGNVLTTKTLAIIENDMQAAAYDRLVIYGEWRRIGKNRLKQKNMEFKQTPYAVKKR
jgi:adenine-specific DNA-methyltransferase